MAGLCWCRCVKNCRRQFWRVRTRHRPDCAGGRARDGWVGLTTRHQQRPHHHKQGGREGKRKQGLPQALLAGTDETKRKQGFGGFRSFLHACVVLVPQTTTWNPRNLLT
ncbi:hypothetical protein BS47DRAFT_692053 [Hydnum rufescens UP504]|uniref:Uncharacterized protein n=1 Tax=Hydnum rufescens UP504 TaxID=1448309 RepID=A0A9P6AED2_9AGAM|nr:hypothetical protein BS47DRAFT_692053 [Hydnum rufescens UP504]